MNNTPVEFAAVIGARAVLTTAVTSSVCATRVTTGGDISYGGGSAIKDRGVCWSILPEASLVYA